MNYELINPEQQLLDKIEQIFFNRNVSDSYHYLNVGPEDEYDCELLDSLRPGAEMLMRHIAAGDRTLVIVD